LVTPLSPAPLLRSPLGALIFPLPAQPTNPSSPSLRRLGQHGCRHAMQQDNPTPPPLPSFPLCHNPMKNSDIPTRKHKQIYHSNNQQSHQTSIDGEEQMILIGNQVTGETRVSSPRAKS
jgi:hypothetical protein